jgi:hypothetical protein
MINTVNHNETLNTKPRGVRKGATVRVRGAGDCLVADLARKTSWAWRINANYMS